MRVPFRARLKLFTEAAAALFSETRAGSMLSGVLQWGDPPKRGTRELLRAYGQMPWLRGVVNKVARSVSSAEWKLYAVRNSSTGRAVMYSKAQHGNLTTRRRALEDLKKQSGELELEEIDSHPFLDFLNAGNLIMTGLVARQVTQMHIDIKGEAYWLIERNNLGVPVAYWPIPPHWVVKTASPAYPYFLVSHGGFREEIPVTEIVWFTDPDPEDPYGRGTGAAESMGDELETDEYAAKHTKAWFYNRARPDILVTGKDLRESEARRLEQQWNAKNQGFWNAFRAHFTNADLNVHQLSQTFESMQLVDLRRFERDTIIQVYGVPPEIMGIITDSNRATIEAASYIYAEHVIVPRLELIRDQMQERLIPQFDSRLILDYVSPVPEDREHALNVARAAPWAFEVDEWREMAGRPPLEDDKGKVFPRPFTVTFTEDLTEDVTYRYGYDFEPGMDEEPPDGQVESDKARMSARRKNITNDDIERIIRRLDLETLRSAILPLYRSLIAEWGQETLDSLDVGISFNDSLPRIARYIQQRDVRIKGMNEFTMKRLRHHLSEGAEAGESVAQLMKRVSEVFAEAKGPRAETIARTEVLGGANWAQMEAFRQSGAVEEKEWLSTRDDRTRDTHAEMDGQIRVLEQPFDSPAGYQTQQPGGFGVPEEDINCRCTVVAVLRDAGKLLLDTEEKRFAHWKRFDERARRDERKFAAALKRAFQAQQNAVSAELRRIGEFR